MQKDVETFEFALSLAREIGMEGLLLAFVFAASRYLHSRTTASSGWRHRLEAWIDTNKRDLDLHGLSVVMMTVSAVGLGALVYSSYASLSERFPLIVVSERAIPSTERAQAELRFKPLEKIRKVHFRYAFFASWNDKLSHKEDDPSTVTRSADEGFVSSPHARVDIPEGGSVTLFAGISFNAQRGRCFLERWYKILPGDSRLMFASQETIDKREDRIASFFDEIGELRSLPCRSTP